MSEILGIGTDIVDIARIAELRRKHESRLADVVFRGEELSYCLSRANADECLAARFAAKEAVMKALGTGWADGVSFTGIEVTREESGRPGIRLHGATRKKADSLGAGKIHLTLSHARDSAVAYVLVEKRPTE